MSRIVSSSGYGSLNIRRKVSSVPTEEESRWNGCPEEGEEKVKREGKKWTYMVRRAVGSSLCVYVCVCVICANGSPGSRNNAMNHHGTPAIDFAPRFANFFESDFTGTLANPLWGDILFLLLIEQESSDEEPIVIGDG